MDNDLAEMTREQLVAEVQRLRDGIRGHRDSSGHELCWHHPALWGLLPEKTDPVPDVPDWPEFMQGCVRYRQSLDEQVHDARTTNTPADVTTPKRAAVVLAPDGGRDYPMGRIRALFKADGDETQGRYSISEWWLEPRTQGPGAHSHSEEDDVFFVIEGTMSVLVDDRWIDAQRGSFVLVPAGMTHDFENRSASRAGVLNFSIPGDFEQHMPAIAKWFAENPPRETAT